jgi:hypothetical protein
MPFRHLRGGPLKKHPTHQTGPLGERFAMGGRSDDEAARGVAERQESVGAEHGGELFGLRAAVDPEGLTAALTLSTSDGPLALEISYEMIAAIAAELRHAEALMLYRQASAPDAGASKFKPLLDTALEPDHVVAMVDRRTGDRLWVHQFADRFPIVLKLTPEKAAKVRAATEQAARRAAS